jgi:hypothetical protein
MEQRQRVLIAGTGIGALLVAAGAWWMTQAEAPPIETRVAATPGAAVPPQPVAGPIASAAAAKLDAPTAAKPSASSVLGKRVQQRLDALAQAYEQGDARAIERAMWPNHAVIRPDGERFDRRELLALWAEEWESFRNRDLKFYVEEVIEDGVRATVIWTILLTADLTAASGETHHMMINGKQQATIVGGGDTEALEGPIEYTTLERTLDGNVWPVD